MSAFSWDGFLSQPWQGPLLLVIAVLLVCVVVHYVESR